MKYVIFKSGDLLKPIIFPDHISHCEITCKNSTPISAGFLTINNFGMVKVYGQSESLNLKPNEDDEKILGNVVRDNPTHFYIVEQLNEEYGDK